MESLAISSPVTSVRSKAVWRTPRYKFKMYLKIPDKFSVSLKRQRHVGIENKVN